MELLKKLLGILLDLLKKGLDLLRGKGLGEIAKKLGLALGGLFLLICTGKSLHALHRARRKAREIKKAVRRAEEVRQKVHAPRPEAPGQEDREEEPGEKAGPQGAAGLSGEKFIVPKTGTAKAAPVFLRPRS